MVRWRSWWFVGASLDRDRRRNFPDRTQNSFQISPDEARSPLERDDDYDVCRFLRVRMSIGFSFYCVSATQRENSRLSSEIVFQKSKVITRNCQLSSLRISSITDLNIGLCLLSVIDTTSYCFANFSLWTNKRIDANWRVIEALNSHVEFLVMLLSKALIFLRHWGENSIEQLESCQQRTEKISATVVLSSRRDSSQ